MSLLELKGIGFKYQLANIPSIRNINLKIEKGEFIGIVGRNGSGKTTLCNVIRGLIPLFSKGEFRGEVTLDGKLLSEYDRGELSEKIGFVFQNPFIQITGIKKTVYDEIAYSLENIGVETNEIKKRVDKIIETLKIEYLKDKNPAELSGGQSQRVALASVLVMNPEIIIVDEPTSQLDPKGTEEVFETLGLLKEQGNTVILVEHKIDLMSEFADRIIVMDDGRIKYDGNASKILSNRDIENYGIQLPKVTKLLLELEDKKGINFNNIATTINNAESILKGVLKNEIC